MKPKDFITRIKRYITPYSIGLLVILIVAAFFRFYNTPDRYGFDFDPTRDALITIAGARGHLFPLVGPPSGIGPFTFGPWYYYQLILFKMIVPVDYAPWIYLGLISMLFIVVMYKIGILLKDRMFGLLLAGLAALSPAQTGPTAGLSNPNLVPLFVALVIWIGIKCGKEKLSYGWYFLWGLILGIGINNHYQALGILPLPFILIALQKEKIQKTILLCLGIFTSFIPLLLFNVMTHWHTIEGLWFYLTQGKNGTYIPNRWLFYIRDFLPGFWSYVIGGVPVLLGEGLLVYSILLVLYQCIKRKLPFIYIVLFLLLLLNLFLLRYYSGQREYYYLLYLHPLLFIFFGYAIVVSWKTKIGIAFSIIILSIISVFAIQQDIIRLADREDNIRFKNIARALEDKYPNISFRIYGCDNSQKNKVQGIAFFLTIHNKLSSSGKKIGFADTKCVLPTDIKMTFLGEEEIVDITHSETVLPHWYEVSPETVYASSLNWWVAEKEK